MTKVYKVQLFKWDLSNKKQYCAYCTQGDVNIVAFGWPPPLAEEFVSSIEDYYNKAPNWFNKTYMRENYSKRAYSNLASWKRSMDCLKSEEKTFVWAKGNNDKEFYLGKLENTAELPNEKNWQLDNTEVKRKEVGILRSCKWHLINFDYVPGDIATYIRKDDTVRLIATEKDNPDYVTYCEFLYKNWNRLEEAFDSIQLNLNFYQLAHTDDLEDLIGLYLQKECDYLIFPSTNKHGTPDYEFELIKKDGSKHAIIQSKYEGEIDVKKLKEYKKDIYLLNVKDPINNLGSYSKWSKKMKDGTIEVIGIESTYDDKYKIFVFNPEKLLEWAACKEENTKILPQRIQNFLKISKGKEDEQITKTR